jgi:FkbM family methyltransferase
MLNIAFIRSVGPFKWLTRYSWLLLRKRIFKIDSRLRLPTGTWMVIPKHSRSSTEVYVTNGNIDWGSEALVAKFADPNRDFLDIGAHVGYYSSYLSSRVRRVYAFEPDPRNIPSLRHNASLAGNVEVIEKAVSSQNGSAILSIGDGAETSSLLANSAGASTPSISVKVTTIDTFVAEHPGIDVALIKTDAEGSDMAALSAMKDLVARNQPLILSECGYNSHSRELCARWNYRVFAFTRDRSTIKLSFEEFTSPESESHWHKMLFLVPPHLAPAFSQLTSAKPARSLQLQ